MAWRAALISMDGGYAAEDDTMYEPTMMRALALERQGDFLRWAENEHRSRLATGSRRGIITRFAALLWRLRAGRALKGAHAPRLPA